MALNFGLRSSFTCVFNLKVNVIHIILPKSHFCVRGKSAILNLYNITYVLKISKYVRLPFKNDGDGFIVFEDTYLKVYRALILRMQSALY